LKSLKQGYPARLNSCIEVYDFTLKDDFFWTSQIPTFATCFEEAGDP
jgi:hypothetical protein